MIKHNIITAFFGSLLCVIFVSIFTSFVPVTVFMKAERWESTRSNITAEVIGYKIRDCLVVRGSYVGWVYSGNVWREIPFEFVNDETPNSSKPSTMDRQSFGLWQWGTQPRDGKLVKMTMQHNCNGSIQTTSIGPFEYQVTR